MRFVLTAVSAASVLLAVGCTSAPESGQPMKLASAAGAKAAAPGDPNRMVCRKERVVGSNRPEKICMTAAEWQGITERSQEDLTRLQGEPGTTPANSAGGGPQ